MNYKCLKYPINTNVPYVNIAPIEQITSKDMLQLITKINKVFAKAVRNHDTSEKHIIMLT